jgi:hypothetical protein
MLKLTGYTNQWLSSSPAAKNGNENIILNTNMGAETVYILSGNFLLCEMVHKQVAWKKSS